MASESVIRQLFQACLPTRQNGVENRDKAYCKQTTDQKFKNLYISQFSSKWADFDLFGKVRNCKF